MKNIFTFMFSTIITKCPLKPVKFENLPQADMKFKTH